jgi:hypothetical protein
LIAFAFFIDRTASITSKLKRIKKIENSSVINMSVEKLVMDIPAALSGAVTRLRYTANGTSIADIIV